MSIYVHCVYTLNVYMGTNTLYIENVNVFYIKYRYIIYIFVQAVAIPAGSHFEIGRFVEQS